MAKRVSIKLVKSTIGQKNSVRSTARSLGLKKINSTVEHEVNPAIEGMLRSVAHIVEVKELN